jgi:TldD protein
MSEALEIANELILSPAGLAEPDLDKVLGGLLGGSIDSADLYFQLSRHESWSLEDGIVKEGSYNIEQGVGVRAISGEKTGFAYSDDLVLPALLDASRAARAIARSGGDGRVPGRALQSGHRLYLPTDPLETLSERDKIELLQALDQEARPSIRGSSR